MGLLTPMPISSTSLPAERAVLRAEEAAALDDEVELARYTTFAKLDGGAQEACSRLVLDGLHCAACASLIEQALHRVDGVLDAQVQAASRRAQVRWDPARTKASSLIEAIQRAGYKAFPDTATQQRAKETLESRRAVWRLFAAGFCMMQVMMYATPMYVAAPGDIGPDIIQLLRWASWLLSLPVVLFAATPFYTGAWRALRHGRIGMDVPIALGVLVTFIASTGATFDTIAPGQTSAWGREVYFDSLTMFVTFLLIGRALEQRARRRAAEALESVLHRLPESVERVLGDQTELVAPARLRVGDAVRVSAGQAFPADGVLVQGHTQVDEALLTGESRPVDRDTGSLVMAGSHNLVNPVVMRVERLGGDTRYERIVALMQKAMSERPSWVRLADQIAVPFLWGVLLLAVAAAGVWMFIDPAHAIWIAVSVLIVTCPCALSLAAPSAMVAAAGALARRGVLVQRFDAFEALAKADTVVFDKTGTLTDDRLHLNHVHALGAASSDLLVRAGALAAYSRHPLSQALARAVQTASSRDDAVLPTWADVRETSGAGLEALDEQGGRWRMGSAAWAGVSDDEALALGFRLDAVQSPRVWLRGPAGQVAGFDIEEALRPDSAQAVKDLQALGLNVIVLSGDLHERVHLLARQLGLNAAHAEARPEDKLAVVARAQQTGHRVVVVGDGINDAPVLARADASFAMGHGAALAQARADFIVLGSHPSDVVRALSLARRTMRVVRQNLGWAVAYNAASVPLAVMGWLPPWLAGLGMASSSLFVVLNALRLGRGLDEVSSSTVASAASQRPVVV